MAQVVGTIGNLFLHLYYFRQRKNREYSITFRTVFINSSGFTHSGGIHIEWSPTLGPRQSCLCSSSKFKANTQWPTIQMWQQEGGKAAPVGLSSLLYKWKNAKKHANVKGVAVYLPVWKFKSGMIKLRNIRASATYVWYQIKEIHRSHWCGKLKRRRVLDSHAKVSYGREQASCSTLSQRSRSTNVCITWIYWLLLLIVWQIHLIGSNMYKRGATICFGLVPKTD